MMMKMKSETEHFYEKVKPVVNIWILLVAYAGCGLSLFSREIVLFTAPESYSEASNPLRFLLIAMALAGTTQVTTIGIGLAEKSEFLAIGSWIAAGINLAINFILVPRFGSSGASFATLVSYLFLTTFYYKVSIQFTPIKCRHDVIALSALVMATGLFLGILEELLANKYQTMLFALVSKSLIMAAIITASGIYFLRKEKISLQELLLRLQKNA
jgi:O-antigen/teichoic acid export membrane protein